LSALTQLAPADIDAYAARLTPLLERIADREGGRYTAEIFLAFARRGDWQLWVASEGEAVTFICATEVVKYPTGLQVLIAQFAVGTGGRSRGASWQKPVLAWAKSVGCELAEGTFRKGWRRVLPGWRCGYVFLEREL
jgi:hypothetical protein